jgi:SAM-dependent methyltransferase
VKATDVGVSDIDEALVELRKAVVKQIGTATPQSPDVDPDSLVRFSPDLPRELDAATREVLTLRAEKLHPWLQGPFLLGGDLVVGGAWRSDHRWIGLGEQVPGDLSGKRVLDVGSNAGYDAFMFSLRRADQVLACEPAVFHHQALLLESIYHTGVDLQNIGWQDLSSERHGRFDLIHCHGVFYHEPRMMELLTRLREMLADGGELFFGTMMLANPELSEYVRFVPGAYNGDPTWWWVPGRLAMRWMLEATGFTSSSEFGTYENGPAGEFSVVNGYFRAGAGDPSSVLAPS